MGQLFLEPLGSIRLLSHPWAPKGRVLPIPGQHDTFITDPETFQRILEKGIEGISDEVFLKSVGIEPAGAS